MTQAVVTIRDGHAFQARQFWIRALTLLDPDGPVAKVGFEVGPKGYDDIWVEYKPNQGPSGKTPSQIIRRHYQCKWHVASGAYGHLDLADPDFINATSNSLLQRAHAAQTAQSGVGGAVQFSLLTNWHINNDDSLRTIVHQRDGSIRLDRLFDGSGKRSASGRLRTAWCEHLAVDEAGLRSLAESLAFATYSQPLLDLRETLEYRLQHYGLRVDRTSQDSCLYDDLIFQWLAAGRHEFTSGSLRDACEQQGLFIPSKPPKKHFGVKSFEHQIDCLDDRCIEVLNLTPHFIDRQIRSHSAWGAEIYPKLKEFLVSAARRTPEMALTFDAHGTLAFAAGSVLNIKAGRAFEIEQRVLDRQAWSPRDSEPNDQWSKWKFNFQEATSEAAGLVVGVSVTHDVAAAVGSYAATALPGHAVLHAMVSAGVGNTSIKSGRHAFDLAEELVREVVRVRKPHTRIHLFVAAPNAMMFFLGQRQPHLGAITLYEFDFEGLNGGGYVSSLSLPIE